MLPPHNSIREARFLSLLTPHPAIIPLQSTFSLAGGSFVLAFPFMPLNLGTVFDYQYRIKKQAFGPTSSHNLLSHIHSLFAALAHIHSHSMIHRDIKPANILLASPTGPAYLADFGIAWLSKDRDCEPTAQKITDVGTTAYRPPELLFGYRAYDESLDLWAAGCVVAEAIGCLGLRRTLFDAGELGSELALIQSIFKTLGTPIDDSWPVSRKEQFYCVS